MCIFHMGALVVGLPQYAELCFRNLFTVYIVHASSSYCALFMLRQSICSIFVSVSAAPSLHYISFCLLRLCARVCYFYVYVLFVMLISCRCHAYDMLPLLSSPPLRICFFFGAAPPSAGSKGAPHKIKF